MIVVCVFVCLFVWVVVMVINHAPCSTHEGSVTCVSFQIALICLSHGRLEDKQRSKPLLPYSSLSLAELTRCLYDLACFFLPSASLINIHTHTQSQHVVPVLYMYYNYMYMYM